MILFLTTAALVTAEYLISVFKQLVIDDANDHKKPL